MNQSEPFWEPRYAERARRMTISETRELLKLLDKPNILSFAGGIPDPVNFPVKQSAQAYAEVLGTPELADAALQYSVSEGYLPLRQWIVEYMGKLGVPCETDNILVTCGSQQALDFLGRLLLSPGDTALVPYPTYLGAFQAFNAYEPRYDRLETEGGNSVRVAADYVRDAEANGSQVKFAYAVPDFDNPTGRHLPVRDREKLIALAEELDVPIIEDSAYVALQYDGEVLPTITALEVARAGSINQARSIYCGTFSKTICPGLRIGWICASKKMINRLVLVKQASDLNSPLLNQMVMTKLATGYFNDLVASGRALYHKRRDAMLEALERYMPASVSWTQPPGGLFIWVTFPEGTDSRDLLNRSLSEARVAFVPGSAFYPDGGGANCARLSFSRTNEEQIDAGIKRLAALL